MGHYREMPHDFHQVMELLNGNRVAVREYYKCGKHALERWLREGGYPEIENLYRQRPVPEDYIQMAAKMHRNQIMLHYDADERMVGRWARKTGVKPIPFNRPGADAKADVIPADFAEQAKSKTLTGLRQHYRTDKVKEWIKRTGIKPLTAGEYVKMQNAKRKERERIRVSNKVKARIGVVHEVAAKTLARYAPTYRCNERGKVDVVGAFFRHGMTVLTPDELLAKAERYRSKAA